MAVAVKMHILPKTKSVFADIVLDSSYPANGYPLAASDFKLSNIELVLAPHTAGYTFEWDAAAHKLKVFRVGASFSNPLAEVSGGTTLAGVTIRALVVGY